MPLSLLWEVSDHLWLLGLPLCDLWHSLDILASTASIWNLAVISIDRYFALKNPFKYPSVMTPGRTSAAIVVVWVCSMLISFPAIAWWRIESPDLYTNPYRCEFVDDFSYLCFSSLLSFYIPLVVMILVYSKIYSIASNQQKGFKQGTKRMSSVKSQHSANGTVVSLRVHRGKSMPVAPKAQRVLGYTSSSPKLSSGSDSVTPQLTLRSNSEEIALMSSSATISGNLAESPITAELSRPMSKKRVFSPGKVVKRFSRFSKEKRAAKTLGIVMGCFVACWTPFFVQNVLAGVCQSCVNSSQLMITSFTWLGYVNSMLNPFIYAFFSRDFRQAFHSILCGWCMRRRARKVLYKDLPDNPRKISALTQWAATISPRVSTVSAVVLKIDRKRPAICHLVSRTEEDEFTPQITV